MEIVTQYWHQIVFLIAAIVVAVRLESEVKSCRKDIDSLCCGVAAEGNRVDRSALQYQCKHARVVLAPKAHTQAACQRSQGP